MVIEYGQCNDTKVKRMVKSTVTNHFDKLFIRDGTHLDPVIFLRTRQRSYFKIVVNPNNAIWDESTDVAIIDRDTLPILWNPGVQAAVKKEPDRWTVEILVPTKDFGQLGPTKEYPWGIQVGRTRFTGGTPEAWAIAPTSGGPYRTMNRWGNLWMR